MFGWIRRIFDRKPPIIEQDPVQLQVTLNKITISCNKHFPRSYATRLHHEALFVINPKIIGRITVTTGEVVNLGMTEKGMRVYAVFKASIVDNEPFVIVVDAWVATNPDTRDRPFYDVDIDFTVCE